MHEIYGTSNFEGDQPSEYFVPEVPIMEPVAQEETEETVDTSVIGISDDRVGTETAPVVEVAEEAVPINRTEVLTRRVDEAIAAAPVLEFTEDGSYPVVQVAGARDFAKTINGGPADEVITVDPPAEIPPNIVTVPDYDSFEELVDISVGKLVESWPEEERPDPDAMEMLTDDIKIHERAHAEEAVNAGLDATYALTFARGEDGLSVGPSVLLSGSATREKWTSVFGSPARQEGPLDLPLAPSYLDDLYIAPTETGEANLEVDIEETPAPSMHPTELGPKLDGLSNIRDIPAVQRPSGGLREEIRRLGDAIEEQEGIDAADLLSEGYEIALPLLRSDMSSKEIAEQLGLTGKDISTQVSGLARRVLTSLTREASQEIVDSVRSEPTVGATLQGLTKQAGVTLSEIRAKHGVSILSLERLFLGKERSGKDMFAFGAVITTLTSHGLSQEDATKLASAYFAERRTKKESKED